MQEGAEGVCIYGAKRESEGGGKARNRKGEGVSNREDQKAEGDVHKASV